MMKVLLFILFIFSLGVSFSDVNKPVHLIPGTDYGIVISKGNNYRAAANIMTYTTVDLTDKNINNGYLNGKEYGEYLSLYLYMDVAKFEYYYLYINDYHPYVLLNMRLSIIVTNARGKACSPYFNINLWDTSNTHDLIVQLRNFDYNFKHWFFVPCYEPTDITNIDVGPILHASQYHDMTNVIVQNGRWYYLLKIGTYRIITNPYNNSHNPSSVLKGKSPYKATVQLNIQQIPPYY